VEADLVRRLPRTTIVGLPSNAVRESVERVRSAIVAAGFTYPKLRVTINLAPADLRKEGTGFDLPIAVAVLAASGHLDGVDLGRVLICGELSLDGQVRTIRGGLALGAMARGAGLDRVFLPVGTAAQAHIIPGVQAVEVGSLHELVAVLKGEVSGRTPETVQASAGPSGLDLEDVRGQGFARRALELAAAGGHNLLLLGPPGAGKTMLASRLPGILPAASFEEALETSRIHSVAGLMAPGVSLLTTRPFRAPHHSITAAGLLGNRLLQPGEASLAHNGVLFLDEVAEFSRSVLELLRAPLESRHVVLSRAAGSVTLPASFMLVAAANPCPCGNWGHPVRPCRCPPASVERYRARLSGPLLDRIDLHVRVPPVPASALASEERGESSEVVRARVERARRVQQDRYRGAVRCNAELSGPQARSVCDATPLASRLLEDAVGRLGLSGRGHDRVLKVSRTIADLDGSPRVEAPHVAEALSFRPDDRES
jgi:magnesium chelatase family protein